MYLSGVNGEKTRRDEYRNAAKVAKRTERGERGALSMNACLKENFLFRITRQIHLKRRCSQPVCPNTTPQLQLDRHTRNEPRLFVDVTSV